MSVSDDFTQLKEQVESADRSIRAAATKGSAELKTMVDEARKHADQRAADLRAKGEAIGDQAETNWHEVQSDWDEHIKRIQARIHTKKAEFDADMAEDDAEWAEADAIAAVDFASAAIEEAEYAVLDAVMARKNADVMAAAT